LKSKWLPLHARGAGGLKPPEGIEDAPLTASGGAPLEIEGSLFVLVPFT